MNNLLEIIKYRSFKWAIILTFIYLGIGFVFLHYGLIDYSWVFFILLPFSLGIAVVKMEKLKWTYLGLAFGIIIFMLLLIAGGLEGIVCVVMTIPIIIPLVWLGTLTNRYLT